MLQSTIDKEMASQAHELGRILIETHPENTKARIVYPSNGKHEF